MKQPFRFKSVKEKNQIKEMKGEREKVLLLCFDSSSHCYLGMVERWKDASPKMKLLSSVTIDHGKGWVSKTRDGSL